MAPLPRTPTPTIQTRPKTPPGRRRRRPRARSWAAGRHPPVPEGPGPEGGGSGRRGRCTGGGAEGDATAGPRGHRHRSPEGPEHGGGGRGDDGRRAREGNGGAAGTWARPGPAAGLTAGAAATGQNRGRRTARAPQARPYLETRQLSRRRAGEAAIPPRPLAHFRFRSETSAPGARARGAAESGVWGPGCPPRLPLGPRCGAGLRVPARAGLRDWAGAAASGTLVLQRVVSRDGAWTPGRVSAALHPRDELPGAPRPGSLRTVHSPPPPPAAKRTSCSQA